jgi:hypothetical protein
MTKKFGNSRKDQFLANVILASIDDDADDLTARSKFNFSYFEVQPAGQDFSVWPHGQLTKLLEKLKEYGRKPLSYWQTQRLGSHPVLSVYGNFPRNSDFSHPKHVPHQVRWGRFRLEATVRLVGFVLPSECSGQFHAKTGVAFDCNTFYVVFLDANHRFYKSEAK